MPGKRLSAADMLGRSRTEEEADELERFGTQHVPTTSRDQVNTTTSELVSETPPMTYQRVTLYIRPDQDAWLDELLDREVRDASGRRIKSISASDICRLALDRLRADVEAGRLPLVDRLIEQANKDGETFAGRKNRGMPSR